MFGNPERQSSLPCSLLSIRSHFISRDPGFSSILGENLDGARNGCPNAFRGIVHQAKCAVPRVYVKRRKDVQRVCGLGHRGEMDTLPEAELAGSWPGGATLDRHPPIPVPVELDR